MVHYFLLAGEQSLARYAHEAALDYFQRGLEIKGDTDKDEETGDLYFGLGRSQAATGDSEALESCRTAFDIYERLNHYDKMVSIAAMPDQWLG